MCKGCKNITYLFNTWMHNLLCSCMVLLSESFKKPTGSKMAIVDTTYPHYVCLCVHWFPMTFYKCLTPLSSLIICLPSLSNKREKGKKIIIRKKQLSYILFKKSNEGKWRSTLGEYVRGHWVPWPDRGVAPALDSAGPHCCRRPEAETSRYSATTGGFPGAFLTLWWLDKLPVVLFTLCPMRPPIVLLKERSWVALNGSVTFENGKNPINNLVELLVVLYACFIY